MTVVARGLPSMTFTATECPDSDRHDQHAFRAALGQGAGQGAHQLGVLVAGRRRRTRGARASRRRPGAARCRARRSTSACTARARPVSDSPNSGAPQPSTATWAAFSPASSSVTERTRLHRVVGVQVGVDVPAVGHGGGQHRGVLARAVHPLAGDPWPLPDQPVRVASSSGQSAGQPSAPKPSPESASSSPTSRTWKSSPVWLPAAIARRGPLRSAPRDQAGERLERLGRRAGQHRRARPGRADDGPADGRGRRRCRSARSRRTRSAPPRRGAASSGTGDLSSGSVVGAAADAGGPRGCGRVWTATR